jgi:hypothetical protein
VNKLREILAARGKEFDEGELKSRVKDYGYNPDELSDSDAQVVADEIAPQSAMTVANGNGKTATSAKSKGRGRKSAKQVSLQDAIVHAAKETETELTTMESAIRQHKGKFVKSRTESIVNEIRNTSTEIVQGVTEKLMEETADAESFLEIGNAFGSSLFPSFFEFEA